MNQLKVGDRAPDFNLPSHLDSDISLSDLRGKVVVMAFFPLAWTPVCTVQIPSYEEDLNRFVELNTQILSISVEFCALFESLDRNIWGDSLSGVE